MPTSHTTSLHVQTVVPPAQPWVSAKLWGSSFTRYGDSVTIILQGAAHVQMAPVCRKVLIWGL